MADFELTMQDPPRTGERFSDLRDLVGENILATFDAIDCEGGEIVIVTENRNWIVLEAEGGFSCDEGPSIGVARPPCYGLPDTKTLADFVLPRDLFNAGVVNAAVYQEMQAKRDAAESAERERKAASLRAQLAKLEAGR